MLTTLDKFLFVLFTVVTILCGIAGSLLLFLYVDPLLSSDLDQLDAHKNVSLVGGLLAIAGMFLGYSVALITCGLLSRRLASASTHQRWVEFLDLDGPGASRYAGLARIILVALIPRERRTRAISQYKN